MKQYAKFLPLLVTLAATAGTFVSAPGFVMSHPMTFLIFNSLSQVLHAFLPSVFGGPQNPPPPVQ